MDEQEGHSHRLLANSTATVSPVRLLSTPVAVMNWEETPDLPSIYIPDVNGLSPKPCLVGVNYPGLDDVSIGEIYT